MMQYASQFGVLAGVLSVLAYAPYISDTIAGKTNPQRASWLIWSALGIIALSSQVYEDAGPSLWFAGAQVLGTVTVFGLSLRYGKGALMRPTDIVILCISAVGLMMWYKTESAAYALAITISVSFLGGLLTARKAFHNPTSETLGTWVISLIASVFAILSVADDDPVLMAYPVYLFVLYCLFVLAITCGHVRSALHRQA